MPDRTSNDQTKAMNCNEFDLLLTDMLDGVLSGSGLDRFQAHARVCRTCGPLLAEAEAGRSWLKRLTEVEAPANLVSSILASTTGVDTQRLRAPARVQSQVSWLDRLQASLSGYLDPIWGTIRQPRFAMSFGMAFFALSVGLTVIGVKPADVRAISLRPAAIRHTYYNTQARVVRYYENIRFVYEVESRVREIKRNITPAEPGPRESRPAKSKDRSNDTSQQPEQKQDRYYSQTESHLMLASAPLGPSVVDLASHDPSDHDLSDHDPSNPDLPVVSVSTYRRFV